MKAKDIMTAAVLSVQPDDDVRRAARIMLQNHCSGLPVTDTEHRLVGIVTEADFLRRAELGTNRKRGRWLEFLLGPGKIAEEYVHSHARKVQEVMTRDPITVDEDTSLEDVVDIMETNRVKRVPVMRQGAMVGIITRANVLRALASTFQTPAQAGSEATDADIRQRLLDHLKAQNWAPVGAIDVVVRNGVVHLWGVLMDDRQKQALVVAAENIPGVHKVVDHLAWVEPFSGTVIYSGEDANETRVA